MKNVIDLVNYVLVYLNLDDQVSESDLDFMKTRFPDKYKKIADVLDSFFVRIALGYVSNMVKGKLKIKAKAA